MVSKTGSEMDANLLAIASVLCILVERTRGYWEAAQVHVEHGARLSEQFAIVANNPCCTAQVMHFFGFVRDQR